VPAEEQTATTDMVSESVTTINISTGNLGKYEQAESSYDTVISATYPIVKLAYGDEDKYPELSHTFEEINKSKKEKQLEHLETSFESAQEEYRTNKKYFTPYEMKENVGVVRSDSTIVSLLFSGYNYFGGRNADYYSWGENYDTKTGKLLSLSDVITDTAGLADAICEQMNEFYGETDIEAVEEFLSDEQYVSWTVGYNGITFYPNELPLKEKAVMLSFEDYPELVDEKYKNVPAAYGAQLSLDSPFFYDVTGDGKADKIQIWGKMDEYNYSYDSYTVEINGKKFTDNHYALDITPAFVHTADGKNILSMEFLAENDYRHTTYLSLGNSINNLGEVSGGMRYHFYEGEETYYTTDVLANPDKFYIEKISQFFCTASGYREYFINQSGMAEAKNINLIFDESHMIELTMRRNIEVDIHNTKTGKSEGKRTLRKGEKVKYFSTDDVKYIYLKCEDGTICRKQVESDDYPTRIDGVDINDLFDGLFFAG